MLTKQEEIAQIERDAKELVANLKVLHEKVGSYQKAKETLEEISESLAGLIEETQALAKESHSIIKAINEIGSGGIFEKLDSLGKGVQAGLQGLESLGKRSRTTFMTIVAGLSVVVVLQILILVMK